MIQLVNRINRRCVDDTHQSLWSAEQGMQAGSVNYTYLEQTTCCKISGHRLTYSRLRPIKLLLMALGARVWWWRCYSFFNYTPCDFQPPLTRAQTLTSCVVSYAYYFGSGDNTPLLPCFYYTALCGQTPLRELSF